MSMKENGIVASKPDKQNLPGNVGKKTTKSKAKPPAKEFKAPFKK